MTKAEELRQEAADSGVDIIDWRFNSENIKGLYCDGTIALNRSIRTSAERASVLAEELGHHFTAAGSILDQSDANNRKQELRGRIWAYNRLIGLEGILKAYRAGCRNRFEMAELLDVTEEMLQKAVAYYRARYGLYYKLDNYVIYFEPLGVMELI